MGLLLRDSLYEPTKYIPWITHIRECAIIYDYNLVWPMIELYFPVLASCVSHKTESLQCMKAYSSNFLLSSEL